MLSDKAPTVLDLTKKLDTAISIYHDERYSDPHFLCSEWCSVADQGYRVSKLELGTQTGTHIDAPAHFVSNGATLEQLPTAELFGRYYLVDLPKAPSLEKIQQLLAKYGDEPILFIRVADRTVDIEIAALDMLLAIPTRLWCLAGEVQVINAPALEFHRRLAQSGKYLVEDLEPSEVHKVPQRGELFAFPLRLVGTSGSPCRVVVRETSNLS